MAVGTREASERLVCKVLSQIRSALREKKPGMGFEEARLPAEAWAIAVKHPAWGEGKLGGTCVANCLRWGGPKLRADTPTMARRTPDLQAQSA